MKLTTATDDFNKGLEYRSGYCSQLQANNIKHRQL